MNRREFLKKTAKGAGLVGAGFVGGSVLGEPLRKELSNFLNPEPVDISNNDPLMMKDQYVRVWGTVEEFNGESGTFYFRSGKNAFEVQLAEKNIFENDEYAQAMSSIDGAFSGSEGFYLLGKVKGKSEGFDGYYLFEASGVQIGDKEYSLRK